MRIRRLFHRTLLMAITLALLTAACGDNSNEGTDQGITVIATTSVLGDIAANVVGDSGTVTTLIPLGASPHEYEASAQQAAAIQRADLVIANGLGLEEGLGDVLESARSDGSNILEIAPRVDPIPFSDGDEGGGDDPHFWLDPQRDADAAQIIATELAALDPAIDWSSNAEAYGAELAKTDEQIQEILSSIPEANRKLVTNHHSFGYFAQRYGFEVIGVVIPGGSTLAEPSSAELSALVAKVEQSGVRAIFGETTESETIATALASELGSTVEIVELYTGSLGEPGSGADTLPGLLITNANRIAGALS